ncbi:acylphosphatase [Chloroflexota bacterium]
MAELTALQATVQGRVQGVFFRAFVSQQSTRLGLTGYVRNLPDGDTVAVCAEGGRQQLEELVNHLRVGPPGARVTKVETRWTEHTGNYSGFSIRH